MPDAANAPVESRDVAGLNGPKVILEGDSGAGKTFAVGTLVNWAAAQQPPRDVDVLFIEQGLETLLGYWRDKGQPIPANLHWHVIPTPALGLQKLTEMAKQVGQLSYELLTKSVDPDRAKQNPYEKILQVFADFPCDRTKTKRGNIGLWGPERILVVDSLSELAWACMKMVIGGRPTSSPPDIGVGQNNLLNLLRFLTQGFAPTLVMTAHLQKQVNELTGAQTLMLKAIGKSISDDIPPLFSEVIYCRREGLEWVWDTASSGVVTKTRYLPISQKIKPDFTQIMDKWVKRQGGLV